MKFLKYKILVIFFGVIMFYAPQTMAANVGDIVNFNIDKKFDALARTQVESTLIKVTDKLYFYVEKLWWDSQSSLKHSEILNKLEILSNEFKNKIYPELTSIFGKEWSPGIDGDTRISVLFEQMNSAEGGYFREADEYEKLQLPTSNQREMVYLSINNIENPDIKVVLAHEFVHLITFNQKNKIFGVEEDVWLNEARADFSSTILGYDDNYEGSNLQSRLKDFIENPSDSITDWSGTKFDYASVSMFMHYLTDHYGISVLSDSLKSKLVGIESINYVLSKYGFKDGFAQTFTNWTIALTVNDCSRGQEYCYKNKNFLNLKLNPALIFLPLSGSSSLSVTNVTKNWAGNWQKIIGGIGSLKLEFSSLYGLNFQVPYIIYDKSSGYSINFLQLNNDEKGEIIIQDFGTKNNSLIVAPSLQTKLSGFDDSDLIYPYTLTVSITGNGSEADHLLIQNLLVQIDLLKKKIAEILAQREQSGGTYENCQINNNLYLGMTGNEEVKCLQKFLKNHGEGIYPEGLVTGNFGNLTRQAVLRLQTKYGISQTGFVGPLTRNKINSILNVGK